MAEEDNKIADPNAWVTSFGDLITLLMTFFVLILSMSVIKMDKVIDAMNSDMGISDDLDVAQLNETGMLDEEVMSKIESVADKELIPPEVNTLDIIEESLIVFVDENKLSKAIDLERLKNGFVIRIRAGFLFEPGESALKKEYLYLLDKIADMLNEVPNNVRIDGHTDDVYSSENNDDVRLSIDRAASVCRYLVEEGLLYPGRIGIVGHGRYRPLHPNTKEENRAKNRRVEIIIKERPKNG